MIKNAGNASIDAELVQEIDEEVKMLRLDFNKINSQVQSLVRNANASTRTAPDTSGYATVDNAALSKLDHKLMKAVQESSMNVTEVKKQIEDMQEMVSRNQNLIKVSLIFMFRSKTWANNSTHLSSIATKPIVSIDRVLMHVPTLLVASATRTRNSLLILS